MTALTELRHASRRLGRRPLFALLAIATLAIAIGANTAVFSLLEGVVLRALPLPDPERLVFVQELAADGQATNAGFATYADLATAPQAFSSMAAFASWRPSIAGDGNAETILGARATASLLPTIAVSPLLGRNFDSSEDSPGGARVALLANGGSTHAPRRSSASSPSCASTRWEPSLAASSSGRSTSGSISTRLSSFAARRILPPRRRRSGRRSRRSTRRSRSPV